MDETMDIIENLLDMYLSKYDTYEHSQTCSSETYKQQEQDMYNARYALLNEIRKYVETD